MLFEGKELSMRIASLVGRVMVVMAVAALVIGAAAEAKKPDIVQTLAKDAACKTLVKAITHAEMVETLKGKGPFTVFAPDDAAWEKVGKDKLDNYFKEEAKGDMADLLKYHVVQGKLLKADLEKMKESATLMGKPVKTKVKEGKLMIDNSTVTKADIECGNGVIHIIDAVLLGAEN